MQLHSEQSLVLQETTASCAYSKDTSVLTLMLIPELAARSDNNAASAIAHKQAAYQKSVGSSMCAGGNAASLLPAVNWTNEDTTVGTFINGYSS